MYLEWTMDCNIHSTLHCTAVLTCSVLEAQMKSTTALYSSVLSV